MAEQLSRESYAPEVPTKNLPPVPYKDMPEPEPLRKVLGPGVILAGIGVGSGEYILWPYISNQVGLGVRPVLETVGYSDDFLRAHSQRMACLGDERGTDVEFPPRDRPRLGLANEHPTAHRLRRRPDHLPGRLSDCGEGRVPEGRVSSPLPYHSYRRGDQSFRMGRPLSNRDGPDLARRPRQCARTWRFSLRWRRWVQQSRPEQLDSRQRLRHGTVYPPHRLARHRRGGSATGDRQHDTSRRGKPETLERLVERCQPGAARLLLVHLPGFDPRVLDARLFHRGRRHDRRRAKPRVHQGRG